MATYEPVASERSKREHQRRERKSKIKPHKKSRKGCKNCRIRKVKCGEERPQCQRCISYSVVCDYQDVSSSLQLSVAKPSFASVRVLDTPSYGLPLWPNEYDKVLATFRSKTAMTISAGQRLTLFQGELVRLAQSHAYLRHAMMTIALMHDSHDASLTCTNGALTKQEAFHWYQATQIFRYQIEILMATEQVSNSERAAVWAASTILGVISFSHIEVGTPGEAWPLGPDNATSGMKWLRMSKGKNDTHQLTATLRQDPVFRGLVQSHTNDGLRVIGSASTRSSPFIRYRGPDNIQRALEPMILKFEQIAESQSLITIVIGFWSFVYSITAEFENLLTERHPAALVILLHWYAKIHTLPVWWLKRRTLLEGQAICIYLERHHHESLELQDQLQWPRSVLFGRKSANFSDHISTSAITGR